MLCFFFSIHAVGELKSPRRLSHELVEWYLVLGFTRDVADRLSWSKGTVSLECDLWQACGKDASASSASLLGESAAHATPQQAVCSGQNSDRVPVKEGDESLSGRMSHL